MRWPGTPHTKTIEVTDDNGLAVMGPDGKPKKKRVKNTVPRFMGLVQYLDTMTFARSFLGPGPSGMKDLLRRLNVPKEFQKGIADYHGPITPEYIGYCRDDVENTWQILSQEIFTRGIPGQDQGNQRLVSTPEPIQARCAVVQRGKGKLQARKL